MIFPDERSLYPAILKGAIVDGWRLFRIEDGSTGKKPFDISGVTRSGYGVGLEIKYLDDLDMLKPFPWRKLQLHQQNWITEYSIKSGFGLVGIYTEAGGLRIFKTKPGNFSTLVRAYDIESYQMTLRNEMFVGWEAIDDESSIK